MSEWMKKMERLAHAYADKKLARYGLLHSAETSLKHDPDAACAALLAHAAQRDHIEDVLDMVQSVELPKPEYGYYYDKNGRWRSRRSYSEQQMRTYGDAREAAGYARGRAAEQERCIAVCKQMKWPGRRHTEYIQGQNDAADKCAEAILGEVKP